MCNIGIVPIGIVHMGICNTRTTTIGFRIRRFPQNTGNLRALCQKTIA